jgi:hypothetical protein
LSKTIYLNQDNILVYENDNIEVKDIKKEVGFIGSTVKFSDLISYTLKLPKSYSAQELKVESEIKFYEEAGLDMSKKYHVIYIHREIEQEDNILIEAIAVEEEHISKVFKDRIEKIKYVDYLTPQFLVFKEFYSLKKIKPKKDAFVYLDNGTSFVAIYKDGEYLYSKSLNSLTPLLKNLGTSYHDFIDLVENKGLDKESYEEDEIEQSELIDRYFSEFFMKINNILMYGRSVFYLDGIDRIFFYTPFKIKNIESFDEFWNLSGVEFTKLSVNDNLNVNQVNLLALHYLNNISDKNEYNFKVFQRPPPIYKTEVGKYSMFAILVLSLFFGDYYYKTTIEDELNGDIKKLNSILNKKEQVAKQEQLKLTLLENKYNESLKKEKEIKDRIKFFTESIAFVENAMKAPKPSKDFVLLSKLLKNNSLKTLSIDRSDNNMSINVYTDKNNRKNVGKFMNDLLNNGFSNVDTKEILLQEKEVYISEIGIKR